MTAKREGPRREACEGCPVAYGAPYYCPDHTKRGEQISCLEVHKTMSKAQSKLMWTAAVGLFVLLLSLHWRISTNAEATIGAINTVDKGVSAVQAATQSNAQRIVDLRSDLRSLAQQVATHDQK